MPIVIAIIIALAGGASWTAQNSLPGDVLYPVKINVNEKVEGWLAMSDTAKANLESDLAAKRLEEAEELASEAKLDVDTRTQLEENFQEHADHAEDLIVKLSDVDARAAADIAANLKVSLEAHQRILANIGTAKDGDTETEAKTLNSTVSSEEKDADEAEADAEKKVKTGPDVESAAQGRMGAAENKIAEVQKFIELKKDSLSVTEMAQVQARLAAAKSLFDQGKAQLDAKSYASAFVLFGQAISAAQETKMLIEAKVEFEGAEPSKSPRPSPTRSPRPSGSPEKSESESSVGARSETEININLGL